MTLPLLIALILPAAAQNPCGSADCPVVADLSSSLDTNPSTGTLEPDWLKVDSGQVTFDSEGTEGGRYHSRILHWPGGASGVTIGRGYDMKYRTPEEVKAELMDAGVDEATAEALSAGAGLSGSRASRFVRNNKKKYELTLQQQHALFETVYGEYEDMTKKLVCGWAGEEGGACGTFWDGLNDDIKTILVDLRYRGDLTSGRWRRQLKKSVTENSLQDFAKVISRRATWSGVPQDRFDRRKEYIQDAAAAAIPIPTPRPDRS